MFSLLPSYLDHTRLAIAMLLAVVWVVGVDAAEPGESLKKSLLIELDSEIVVMAGDARVTAAELEAVIAEIPGPERAAFVSSPRRIAEAVDRLVQFHLLAESGLEAGLLEREGVNARLYNSAIRELALLYLQDQVEQQMLEDYSVVAREMYLAEPDLFRTPRLFDFTHLLIGVNDREEREAMALILEAWDRLEAGETFDDLVVELSEDPTVSENNGRLEAVERGQLDRNFSRALEGIENVGDISGPVRSRFGWHLIRLDAVHIRERRSWEDAKDDAMEMARSRHQERLRRRIREDIVGEPSTTTIPDLIETIQERYQSQ